MQSPRSPPTSPTQYLAAGTTVETNWSAAYVHRVAPGCRWLLGQLESRPMESATLRRVPPLPSAVQIGLIFGLLLLAAVAWAMTGDRMAGMDAGPGTDLGGLGFWLTAWVVMMAAMMFPSIAPMVVMYARIEEGKRRKRQPTQAGTTGSSSAATFSPGQRRASWPTRSSRSGGPSTSASWPGTAAAPTWRAVSLSRPRSTSSPRSRTSACGTAGTR